MSDKVIEFEEEVPLEEIMRYPGEYYAIVDHKIVAHGNDPAKVRQEARKISPHPAIGKAPTHEVVIY
ncbi:MAG: DUF5678 domain-containing protein [Nitrospirota bacterium]